MLQEKKLIDKLLIGEITQVEDQLDGQDETKYKDCNAKENEDLAQEDKDEEMEETLNIKVNENNSNYSDFVNLMNVSHYANINNQEEITNFEEQITRFEYEL